MTVIDYLLLSSDVFEIITSFEVVDFNPLFSDVHCRLEFSSKYACAHLHNDFNVCHNSDRNYVKWKSAHETNFVSYIQEDVNGKWKFISETLDVLMDKERTSVTDVEVNDVVSLVSDLFKDSAKYMFGERIKRKNSQRIDIKINRGLLRNVILRDRNFIDQNVSTVR